MKPRSRLTVTDSFPELSRSDLDMKTNFVIERTRLLQNKVIRQCLADQLFASAFGFDRIIDLLTTVKSRFFAQPRPILGFQLTS